MSTTSAIHFGEPMPRRWWRLCVGGEFECISLTPATTITFVCHCCFLLRLVADCGSDLASSLLAFILGVKICTRFFLFAFSFRTSLDTSRGRALETSLRKMRYRVLQECIPLYGLSLHTVIVLSKEPTGEWNLFSVFSIDASVDLNATT